MIWAWKNLDYLTGLGLTLWYIGLGLEKYLNYLIVLGLILWHIELGLEQFSDYLTGIRLILWYIGLGRNWKRSGYLTGLRLILLWVGLGLKNWINQEAMSLEKYEGFLELSVEQFVIQSSPISLGQIMWGVWKP